MLIYIIYIPNISTIHLKTVFNLFLIYLYNLPTKV